MYSPSREVAYVHVPKTAGTTTQRYLDALASDWEPHRDAWRSVDGIWPHLAAAHQSTKHMSANELRHLIGAERFDRACSFGVVRNPFDRLLSFYAFVRTTPRRRLRLAVGPVEHARAAARATSFPSFLRRCLAHPERSSFLFQQWQYLCDPTGVVLVDHVLRFESFDDQLHQLAAGQGWPPLPSALGRLNESTRASRGYRDAYPRDVLAEVKALTATDCELFGYEF